MHALKKIILGLTATGLYFFATPSSADYTVICESRNNQYQRCPLSQPGYVTIKSQLSRGGCQQGRSWDFDRREVWVDDGCRAEFHVNTYNSNRNNSGSNTGAKVAGVVIGAAILGAMVNNANHKDDQRYTDNNYQGGRHSSYVPNWMVGEFEGYNPQYGVDVRLTIYADGRAKAASDGQRFDGWVNNGELHMEGSIFNLIQVRNGFETSQVGDRHNVVRYNRIR